MDLKLDKKTLKYSFIIGILSIAFNFIFYMVAFLLIWSWLIPTICIFIPPLKKWFEVLNQGDLSKAYIVMDAISSVVAMFPACALALRLSKKRKQEFLNKTGGIVSYKEGIRLHYLSYGRSDMIAYLSLTLFFALIFIIFGDVIPARIFPLVCMTFKSLGIILGLLTTIITLVLSNVASVFFAQRKWRAEHFID